MEANSHGERPHSGFGGSSAERNINCYGALALIKKYKIKTVETKAMRGGTLGHELSEVCLYEWLRYQETGKRGKKFLKMASKFPEEMKVAAEEYRDLFWTKVLESSITDKAWGVETKLYVSKEFDSYGFTDSWAVYVNDKSQRMGAIVDYKYGYFEVPVHKNAQLAFYAVGLRNFIRTKGVELDAVRTIVIQPRSPGETYKEPLTKAGNPQALTSKQLDAWEKKFLKALKDIYVEKKVKFKIGSWCGFCPASAKCPKQNKEKLDLLTIKKLPKKLEEVPLPSVEGLTDEQVAVVVLNADPFRKWVKSCESYAAGRVKMGHDFPGVKAVTVPGRAKWLENHKEIAEDLIEEGVEEPYNKKLKSITDMRKAVGKKFVDQHVIKGPDSWKLVPESDDRPRAENLLDLLDS